jgi:fucose permease
MIFFLTQYLQDVLGYSALEAGVRTMPVAAGLILGGPTSARLAERLGAKRVVAGGLTIVAAGLYLVSTAQVDTGYGLIAAALVLLGFGMANAMAPATDAIMGTLPAAKMSVGSAVNDTTRTAGGTLGVAVLGSLLSSGYRGGMDAVTAGLPAQARDAAQDSVAGAMAVAQRVGGATGHKLAATAQDAFMSGMHTASLAAAAIALAGALVALAFLPARDRRPVGEAVTA